jgi:catechol 2,3-dioxygenase
MYRTKIGHVHLKVRDLNQSVQFYSEVLNMTVTEQVNGHFAFLSGGDLHHELALQEVGNSAVQPPHNATGLYHTAFEVEDKTALAKVWQKVLGMQIPVAAVDHGISWAMYFADPDSNGVEVYTDTRQQPGGRNLWGGMSRPLSTTEIGKWLDG